MRSVDQDVKKFTVFDAGRYINRPTIGNLNNSWNFRQNPRELLVTAGARNQTMFSAGNIPMTERDTKMTKRKEDGWKYQPGPHPVPAREFFSYETSTERNIRNNVFSDGFPRSAQLAEKKLDDQQMDEARLERLNSEYLTLLDKAKFAYSPETAGAFRSQAEEVKEAIDRIVSGRTQESFLSNISKNMEQLNLKFTPEGMFSAIEGVEQVKRGMDLTEQLSKRARQERLEELKAMDLGGSINFSVPERDLDGNLVLRETSVRIPDGETRIQFLKRALENEMNERISELDIDIGAKRTALMQDMRRLIDAGAIDMESIRRTLEGKINRESIETLALAMADARGSALRALNLEVGDLQEAFSADSSPRSERSSSEISDAVRQSLFDSSKLITPEQLYEELSAIWINELEENKDVDEESGQFLMSLFNETFNTEDETFYRLLSAIKSGVIPKDEVFYFILNIFSEKNEAFAEKLKTIGVAPSEESAPMGDSSASNTTAEVLSKISQLVSPTRKQQRRARGGSMSASTSPRDTQDVEIQGTVERILEAVEMRNLPPEGFKTYIESLPLTIGKGDGKEASYSEEDVNMLTTIDSYFSDIDALKSVPADELKLILSRTSNALKIPKSKPYKAKFNRIKYVVDYVKKFNTLPPDEYFKKDFDEKKKEIIAFNNKYAAKPKQKGKSKGKF